MKPNILDIQYTGNATVNTLFAFRHAISLTGLLISGPDTVFIQFYKTTQKHSNKQRSFVNGYIVNAAAALGINRSTFVACDYPFTWSIWILWEYRAVTARETYSVSM